MKIFRECIRPAVMLDIPPELKEEIFIKFEEKALFGEI
jgi:hypothetical protein